MNLSPGALADEARLRTLFDEANRLVPTWSRSTLAHRITGESDFEAKVAAGRVTVRRLSRCLAAAEAFIEERTR